MIIHHFFMISECLRQLAPVLLLLILLLLQLLYPTASQSVRRGPLLHSEQTTRPLARRPRHPRDVQASRLRLHSKLKHEEEMYGKYIAAHVAKRIVSLSSKSEAQLKAYLAVTSSFEASSSTRATPPMPQTCALKQYSHRLTAAYCPSRWRRRDGILPTWIMAGPDKSGTTSIYDDLMAHPQSSDDVTCKELHF